MFRSRVADYEVAKAVQLGDFLPSVLKMAEGERPVKMFIQNEYPEKDHFVFLFANGKGVRVSVAAYEIKGNRKKLTGAFSAASPIVGVFYEKANKPIELLLVSDDNRAIFVKSSLLPEMSTRSASGTQIVQLKKGAKLTLAMELSGDTAATLYEEAKAFRKIKVPAAGTEIKSTTLLETIKDQ
jgi:DNA gyrase subunit A